MTVAKRAEIIAAIAKKLRLGKEAAALALDVTLQALREPDEETLAFALSKVRIFSDPAEMLRQDWQAMIDRLNEAKDDKS